MNVTQIVDQCKSESAQQIQKIGRAKKSPTKMANRVKYLILHLD